MVLVFFGKVNRYPPVEKDVNKFTSLSADKAWGTVGCTRLRFVARYVDRIEMYSELEFIDRYIDNVERCMETKGVRSRYQGCQKRLEGHSKAIPPLCVGDRVVIQNQYGKRPNKWEPSDTVFF